jgi:hypothetical protein
MKTTFQTKSVRHSQADRFICQEMFSDLIMKVSRWTEEEVYLIGNTEIYKDISL